MWNTYSDKRIKKRAIFTVLKGSMIDIFALVNRYDIFQFKILYVYP